jgi:hypothetical protein
VIATHPIRDLLFYRGLEIRAKFVVEIGIRAPASERRGARGCEASEETHGC